MKIEVDAGTLYVLHFLILCYFGLIFRNTTAIRVLTFTQMKILTRSKACTKPWIEEKPSDWIQYYQSDELFLFVGINFKQVFMRSRVSGWDGSDLTMIKGCHEKNFTTGLLKPKDRQESEGILNTIWIEKSKSSQTLALKKDRIVPESEVHVSHGGCMILFAQRQNS